ncbi:MAG: hypothetical protein AAFY81_04245 [Pseudomonadota bacterium]
MWKLLKLASVVSLYALSVVLAWALAGLIDASGEHELRSTLVSGIAGLGSVFAATLGDLAAPVAGGIGEIIAGQTGADIAVSDVAGLGVLLGLILLWSWLRADIHGGGAKPAIITGLFVGLFAFAAMVVAALMPWPGDEFTRSLIIGAFVGLPVFGLGLANLTRALSEGASMGDAMSRSWERFIAAIIYFTLAMAISAIVELFVQTPGFAFALAMSLMLILIGGVEIHTSKYRGLARVYYVSAGLALIAVPVLIFALFAVDWMIFIEMLPGATS